MNCKIDRKKLIYRQSHNQINVHGGMKYKCLHCGKESFLCLEVGVEDFGKNGRAHQPCPFMISCECGNRMQDISGYLPLPSIRPISPNMKYFAYDNSGSESACGIPSIFIENEEK